MKIEFQKPNFADQRLHRAYVFAMSAHASVGQKRKYSDEPYIVHPAACVGILQSLPESSGITLAQQIAMVCHDTVEDTRKFVDENGNVVPKPAEAIKAGRKIILVPGITFDLFEDMVAMEPTHPIGYRHPSNVALAVDARRILEGLTDVSMPWDGKRDERKALDLAHTAEQAPDVKTCKLADLIDNAPSIIEHDPGFARKWMREKEALLDVLKDGDPILYDIAMDIMRDYNRRNHNRAA
jgi:hypothetical protein